MIRWMMNEIHAEKYLKIFYHHMYFVDDDVGSKKCTPSLKSLLLDSVLPFCPIILHKAWRMRLRSRNRRVGCWIGIVQDRSWNWFRWAVLEHLNLLLLIWSRRPFFNWTLFGRRRLSYRGEATDFLLCSTSCRVTGTTSRCGTTTK